MTASTSDIAIPSPGPAAFDRLTATIKNTVPVFQNTMGCLDATGFAKPFEGLADELLVGPFREASNGGTVAATGVSYLGLGDTVATASMFTGSEKWPLVAIVGLTSAAQLFDPVYMAGDDHTFTMVPPATNPQEIGICVGFASAALGDLLITPFTERLAAGEGEDVWMHFTFGAGTGSDLAAAASVLGNALPAPFHGLIVDAYARNPGVAMTGGPVTITPCIAGVPTAGGDVVLTVTLAAKAKVAATPITGTNEVHKGDALDWITKTVTAFTGGGPLEGFMRLRKLPGA